MSTKIELQKVPHRLPKTRQKKSQGNYHRGRPQLCACATFSATTVQPFPAVQVFCCLRVWTDFPDFESVDEVAVIKDPALICIFGLRPT